MREIRLAYQKLVDALDSLLNNLTTYKLVLYLLYAYIIWAIVLSFAGKLPFTVLEIAASGGCLLATSFLLNTTLARFFNIPKNKESDQITALILSLILTPATSGRQFMILATAAVLANISKYLLVLSRSHVFNPAAFGAFGTGILLGNYASWWVGTDWMAPTIIVGAVLVARKMKRFSLITVFIFAYLATLALTSTLSSHNLKTALLSSSLIFFASIMLTEPLTSPRSKRPLLIYGFLTALLYGVPKLGLSPEEALLLGNIVALVIEPNKKIELILKEKRTEAEAIYSYVFTPAHPLHYLPGQYLELTIPSHNSDSRGNRRYLTVSSSPTEDDMMFTVKVPEKMSSFKNTLQHFKPGDKLLADQLAGSFVLPESSDHKLAFIAGGIGVTPFRSMAKAMVDNQQRLEAVLLYFASSMNEFAFGKDFEAAHKYGLKTHYCLTSDKIPADWKGLKGNIDSKLIASVLSDYSDRIFYISGPQGFVHAAEESLIKLGLPNKKIVTDFFPGYN